MRARDIDYIKTKDGSLENTSELSSPSRISIRVSPHNYLVAIFLGTFFSAFFFYLEFDLAGIILFCLSWIILPFFALNDRIVFDGRRLSRAGFLPRFWARFNRTRRRLKLSDVERVETQTIRTLHRGGKVFYRYRTSISGKGLRITVVSGGENYRRIIRTILPLLSDNVLDNRSTDLRDHLADPKETLMRAEFLRIPSAEALESQVNDIRARGKQRSPMVKHEASHEDDEKAEDLRGLANQLKVAGYPLRALEAFRRALVLRRSDARLLFEFGQCLYAFASVERDKRLERKSLAAMRLAEQRACGDIDLMTRIGECYFQIGEWRHAARVFQNATDQMGENFRVSRGMAEIALRNGKIAHVIHHFSNANRVAETPALRRWSRGETEYFSHLNSDDEYMEMEVSRVGLLETLETSKKTALRILYFAFPIIIVGLVFDDDLIANIGWAVSAVSLLIWVGMQMGTSLLGQRIPYDLIETDD